MRQQLFPRFAVAAVDIYATYYRKFLKINIREESRAWVKANNDNDKVLENTLLRGINSMFNHMLSDNPVALWDDVVIAHKKVLIPEFSPGGLPKNGTGTGADVLFTRAVGKFVIPFIVWKEILSDDMAEVYTGYKTAFCLFGSVPKFVKDAVVSPQKLYGHKAFHSFRRSWIDTTITSFGNFHGFQ